MCDIVLKNSRRRLQLCFKPHFSRRFACKVMGPQSRRSPVMGISGLPLGSPGTKWHLGANPMARHIIYYKGKVVASSKFGSWWVLWVCVCPWFVRPPKCYNYALTNLLFGLCSFVWVNEVLVNLPSPIPELQHAPLPPKCYEPRSVPQLLLLPLFSPLGSYLSPSRSLGVCHSNLESGQFLFFSKIFFP